MAAAVVRGVRPRPANSGRDRSSSSEGERRRYRGNRGLSARAIDTPFAPRPPTPVIITLYTNIIIIYRPFHSTDPHHAPAARAPIPFYYYFFPVSDFYFILLFLFAVIIISPDRHRARVDTRQPAVIIRTCRYYIASTRQGRAKRYHIYFIVYFPI